MKIKVENFDRTGYQAAVQVEVERITASRNIVSFPTYNIITDDSVTKAAIEKVDRNRFVTFVEYNYLGVAVNNANEPIIFAYGSDNKVVTLNANVCEVVPD